MPGPTFPPAFTQAFGPAQPFAIPRVGDPTFLIQGVPAAVLGFTGSMSGPGAPPVTPYIMTQAVAAAGSTTLAATVATASGQGDLIAVWVTANATTDNITGVSDPVNGAYQLATQGSATPWGHWYVMPGAQPLATSQAITAQFSGTGGSKTLQAVGIPGVTWAGELDLPVAANGSSTTPAVATGALAQAGEVIVLGLATNGTNSPTWNAPVTQLGTPQRNATAQWSTVGYDTEGTAAGQAYTATTSNNAWVITALPLLMQTAPVVQPAPATMAAAVTLTAPAALVPAAVTLAAQASVTSPAVTERAPATLAAGTSVSPAEIQGAIVTLAVQGSVSAPVTQLATASLLAQFTVTSTAVQRAAATLAATSALGGSGSTVIPGAASLTAVTAVLATAGQAVPALLAAQAALNSAGAVQAPAALAAGTSVTAGGIQQAAAVLAALTALSAAGVVQVPFTVGVLTAADAPGSILTAGEAPGGVLTAGTAAASTLTATVA